MPELLVVLDDCGDAVKVPIEAEAVLPHIIVRKSLDKVQPKHRRQATQNTKNTPFLLHSIIEHVIIENKDELCHHPTQKY